MAFQKNFFNLLFCLVVIYVFRTLTPSYSLSQSFPEPYLNSLRDQLNAEHPLALRDSFFHKDSTSIPFHSYASDKYSLRKPLNSMGVEESWKLTFDSYTTEQEIEISDHSVDSEGNIYVTGMLYNPGSKMDIALIKYDSLGTEEWVRFYNGTANADDIAEGVTVDQDDNIYVYGASNDVNTGLNGLLLQYSGSGEKNWEYNHVVELSIGNIIQVEFDSSGALLVLTNETSRAYIFEIIYLSKINNSGELIWQADVTECYSNVENIEYVKMEVYQDVTTIFNDNKCINTFEVHRFNSDGLLEWRTLIPEFPISVRTFIDNGDIDINDQGEIVVSSHYAAAVNNWRREKTFFAVLSNDGEIQSVQTVGDGKPIIVEWTADNSILICFFNEETLFASKMTPDGILLGEQSIGMERSPSTKPFVDSFIDTEHNQYILVKAYPEQHNWRFVLYKITDDLQIMLPIQLNNLNVWGYPASAGLNSATNSIVVSGYSDPFVSNFSLDGQVNWEREVAYSAELDHSDIYKIASDSQGNLVAYISRGVGENQKYYLVKYTPNMSAIFDKAVSGNASIRALQVDGKDEIICGYYSSTENSDLVILIQKFSDDGEFRWEKRIQSPPDSSGRSFAYLRHMTTDILDNIYFSSFTDKGDIFSGKLSPNGEVLWTHIYDGPFEGYPNQAYECFDYVEDIQPDQNGNLYMAGRSIGIDTQHLLMKYNQEGQILWKKYYGDGGYSQTAAMCIDYSGDIISTGTANQGDSRITYVRKYTPAGDLIFAETYKFIGSQYSTIIDIATDLSNNIYLAGSTREESYKNANCLLVKFDPEGNFIADKTYDLGGSERTWAMKINSNNIYLFCARGSSISLSDVLTLKYDSDLYLKWEILIAASGYTQDEYIGYAIGNYGDIYLQVKENYWNYSVFKYQQTGDEIPVQYIPEKVVLRQNFPNPFQNTTRITYELPGPSPVEFSVFNILGRKVLSYDFENQPAGEHNMYIDGLYLTSGIYYYQMKSEFGTQTKKMVLVR